MEAGQVFAYDGNGYLHAVYNEGDDDRMTLMYAIRCD